MPKAKQMRPSRTEAIFDLVQGSQPLGSLSGKDFQQVLPEQTGLRSGPVAARLADLELTALTHWALSGPKKATS